MKFRTRHFALVFLVLALVGGAQSTFAEEPYTYNETPYFLYNSYDSEYAASMSYTQPLATSVSLVDLAREQAGEPVGGSADEPQTWNVERKDDILGWVYAGETRISGGSSYFTNTDFQTFESGQTIEDRTLMYDSATQQEVGYYEQYKESNPFSYDEITGAVFQSQINGETNIYRDVPKAGY